MGLTMVCTVASKDPVCWDYGHEHPRAREIPTAGANLGVIQTQSLKSLEKLCKRISVWEQSSCTLTQKHL